MKKVFILLFMWVLLWNAYAADNKASKIDSEFYDIILEEAIMREVCKDVQEGDKCNIPFYVKDIQGLCCDNRCKRNVRSCEEEEPPGLEPTIDIVKKLLCIGKKDNADCLVGDETRGVTGKCCNGMCHFAIKDCDELEVQEITVTTRRPTAAQRPIEESVESVDDEEYIRERIETLSCLGIPDKGKCMIPGDLVEEYRLFGVCCDEKCNFRTNDCPPEPVVSTTIKGQADGAGSSFLIITLVGFILLLCLIVLLLLILRFIRKKGPSVKPGGLPPSPDYELRLKRLKDEKNSIEEMIRLAQLKFHKRKLDEESFREIVRNQQEKLIGIEAKIKGLEDRMTKLEEGKEK